jgi:oligoribonuclease NrnB/cAMP/cGMP phosphodiesterase (DHH superfamily)
MKKKQVKTKSKKKKMVKRKPAGKKSSPARRSIKKKAVKKKAVKKPVRRKVAKKQGPTTYDIFFHNDFDGRASAAILVDFLKGRKDRVERFVPVDYDLKPMWHKKDALQQIARKAKKGKINPVIIVDFIYHPAAAWWFDHHPTAFIKEAWENSYQPGPTRHFAPEYASATHLVMDALEEYHGYRPGKHIRDMSAWLDVCDGAQYRSARQTILLNEPALQLSAFIDDDTNKGKSLDWLIKILADKGIAAAMRDRRVKKVMPKIRAEYKLGLDYFKKNLVLHKKVAFIDKTGLGKLPTLRHAPFYLHPNLIYSIMRKKAGQNEYRFQVGVNAWKTERNPIHIGGLLMKYGGGGHRNVGAANVQGEAAAEKFGEYLITLLNNAVA